MLPLVRGRRHRRDPVEPARARPADARLGRRPPSARETDEFGKTLYEKTADADRKVVEAVGGDRRASAACRARRSRWPGCWPSPRSRRRSSARPSSAISTTRSPRSTRAERRRDRPARGALCAARGGRVQLSGARSAAILPVIPAKAGRSRSAWRRGSLADSVLDHRGRTPLHHGFAGGPPPLQGRMNRLTPPPCGRNARRPSRCA